MGPIGCHETSVNNFCWLISLNSRSQWLHGLRRRSAAAPLLRSWVWIPSGAWIFACCECCVLSGRGLCDELITRPEESYRLWCVVVCDLETSRIGAPYIYVISSLRVNLLGKKSFQMKTSLMGNICVNWTEELWKSLPAPPSSTHTHTHTHTYCTHNICKIFLAICYIYILVHCPMEVQHSSSTLYPNCTLTYILTL